MKIDYTGMCPILLILQSDVRPVCLPWGSPANADLLGKCVIGTGWGANIFGKCILTLKDF